VGLRYLTLTQARKLPPAVAPRRGNRYSKMAAPVKSEDEQPLRCQPSAQASAAIRYCSLSGCSAAGIFFMLIGRIMPALSFSAAGLVSLHSRSRAFRSV
jgi:hypothetical protein